jgi:hypothetical protein
MMLWGLVMASGAFGQGFRLTDMFHLQTLQGLAHNYGGIVGKFRLRVQTYTIFT